MNFKQGLGLLVIIVLGATIANLIALKIAADQVSSQLSGNSTVGVLSGLLGGGSSTTATGSGTGATSTTTSPWTSLLSLFGTKPATATAPTP